MHAAVTDASIERANALFWNQMLAMELVPIVGDLMLDPSARCIGVGHVVGSCDLSGVWNGRIEIRLSRGLAMHATSAMLMRSEETVEIADVLDAAKEIANMIAGTIKSALPRPCAMTVPSAVEEKADFCIPRRTQDSVTVYFHHPAGELMVRVWEREVDQESEISRCVGLCA
jgi:CheY-specific phosphatase CheX